MDVVSDSPAQPAERDTHVTRKVTGQSTDPLDPWAIAQTNGYDIDNFYIRSTDSKGHSENVQARLSPAMVGELGALIHSQQLPYRTVQDFIRDACVHRAKYVSDLISSGRAQELGFGPMIAAEAMIARIEQNRERRRLGIRLLEEAGNEIKEMRDSGRRSEAWDVIEEFVETSQTWVDETVYPRMQAAIQDWRDMLVQTPATLRRVQ